MSLELQMRTTYWGMVMFSLYVTRTAGLEPPFVVPKWRVTAGEFLLGGVSVLESPQG
jgi:hypothetical protein